MNTIVKSVDNVINKLDKVTKLVETLNKKGSEGVRATNKTLQRAIKSVLREANGLINKMLSLVTKAGPSEIKPLIDLIKKLVGRVFKVSAATSDKGLNLLSDSVLGVTHTLTQIPRGLTKQNKKKRTMKKKN